MRLKFPAPYFGGKSRIASRVWELLGQVPHYLEPCFGSGAVLLARPNYDPRKHIETVCDLDGHVCNVWRALQFAPEEVAKYCDWPVNHIDLNARRRVLIAKTEKLVELLTNDEKAYDAELAGYWIWCASTWIGHDMTSPNSMPLVAKTGESKRINGQLPHCIDTGMGIHALGKVPFLVGESKGINGQRPHLGAKGVHAERNENIYAWFDALSIRLRRVRVVCGDWKRICGGDWQDAVKGTGCGIFFDPPYSDTDRDLVYQHDSTEVAKEIAAWCLERGSRSTYRIVLCGYEGEHPQLIEAGWRTERWKTKGGYGNTARGGKVTRGKINRKRECLWISPHCLRTTLFDAAPAAEK